MTWQLGIGLIASFAAGYGFAALAVLITAIIASLKRIYASYKARRELPPPGSAVGE